MKVLQIDSSILGAGSVSRGVTRDIVNAITDKRPEAEVIHRDLAEKPLPHLVLSMLGDANDPVLAEFMGADIVVIGAPTYNFGIPSQLKAWIDRIVVNGKTFAIADGKAVGLAGEKRVIVAVTRGMSYDAGSALEHVESYLRPMLAFIGIAAEFIVLDGLRTPARDQAVAEAQNAVRALRIA